MNGYIFDIKHFAVHDGPGIRTTVFFKACPLRCLWCHNPESISGKAQLGFIEHKCVHCARCVAACPNGAHYTENGSHRFDRTKCTACGTCVEACYSKALSLYGKYVSVDQVISELLDDEDFYESSGGGVTLSGGECLLQADFCAELLRKLKENGIHTAVDTCGSVGRNALDMVIPHTDLFLYDIKAIDEDVHKKCTGRSNKLILENLIYLTELGKNVEIRIPFVPKFNSDQIEKIGEFLSDLKNIVGVRILPYHNYAGTKYTSIGLENTLPDRLPTDDELESAKSVLKSFKINILE